MTEPETATDEAEHPEMDRAAAEVAAIVAPHADGVAGEKLAPWTQAETDRYILSVALCRLARLHGVNVPGEMPPDIDTSNLSPKYVAIVEWAKTARVS